MLNSVVSNIVFNSNRRSRGRLHFPRPLRASDQNAASRFTAENAQKSDRENRRREYRPQIAVSNSILQSKHQDLLFI